MVASYCSATGGYNLDAKQKEEIMESITPGIIIQFAIFVGGCVAVVYTIKGTTQKLEQSIRDLRRSIEDLNENQDKHLSQLFNHESRISTLEAKV